MLLKKIEFKKLFGMYDHEVKLFKDGISIVIGKNGMFLEQQFIAI